jgi:hypothetical protein
MDLNILAMVDVVFNKIKLSDSDIQTLEEFLRKQDTIDSLVVQPQRVTFYIWGRQVVDYKILDGFKDKLESLGYHDFIIVAREYKETVRREFKGE